MINPQSISQQASNIYNNEIVFDDSSSLHWSGGSEICEGEGVLSHTLWQTRKSPESLSKVFEVFEIG